MNGTKKMIQLIKAIMIIARRRSTANQRKNKWRIRFQRRNRKLLAPIAPKQVQDLMLDPIKMHRGRLRITNRASLIASKTKVMLSWARYSSKLNLTRPGKIQTFNITNLEHKTTKITPLASERTTAKQWYQAPSLRCTKTPLLV